MSVMNEPDPSEGDSTRAPASAPPSPSSASAPAGRETGGDDVFPSPPSPSRSGLTIREFQDRIGRLYGAKDSARGDAGTFLWLAEEFGELATALRVGTPEELAAEMADVLAWLATLANVRGVDLERAAAEKYGRGCPGCGASASACVCDPSEKP